MSEPQKGRYVVIIEGPEQGTEGKLERSYKYFDTTDNTNRKMASIRVTEEGRERIVRTRMAWVRETEQNFINEELKGAARA